MKPLALALLLVTALEPVQGKQTFTGVITDDMCANGDHSKMKMGPSAAECAIACVDAHGASFVLHDGQTIFRLNDQKSPEKFAGKKVNVTGTLDAKTKVIRVDSMTAAK